MINVQLARVACRRHAMACTRVQPIHGAGPAAPLQDRSGRVTPLYFACGNGEPGEAGEIVEMLLAKGADPAAANSEWPPVFFHPLPPLPVGGDAACCCTVRC